MAEFFLHFFPLATIGLGVWALVEFILYMNSLQRIEDHMKSNRRDDWEKMGKPGIFSGKLTEENAALRSIEASTETEQGRDTTLESLFVRSKRIKRRLGRVLWSGFGLYIFTIFAVRYLLQHIEMTG
ncbi:MAG: hypothetical protein AAF420_00820 [Pseudomonadota bacterium]